MAIKILSTVAFQARCSHCRSKLSFEYNDVVFDRHTDISGHTDEYNHIKCPNCGYDISVGNKYYWKEAD